MMSKFAPQISFVLGDLISTGAGGATVPTGANAGTSAGTPSGPGTEAAARLVRIAAEASAQRNATQGTAIASTITTALAALASAAGGPAGQWISFLLGGGTAPPSTTIAPTDLKIMKDVFTPGVPIAVTALTLAKFAVSSDSTALAVLDYFIGYLPRLSSAVAAACIAGGPDCGVGATVTSVAKYNPSLHLRRNPFPPVIPNNGGGGIVNTAKNVAPYAIATVSLAIGAFIYFMKK